MKIEDMAFHTHSLGTITTSQYIFFSELINKSEGTEEVQAIVTCLKILARANSSRGESCVNNKNKQYGIISKNKKR